MYFVCTIYIFSAKKKTVNKHCKLYKIFVSLCKGADPKFQVQPTSYDYDSPLTEAGDVTDKYLALREAISKYLPIPKVPVPANSTKFAYGKVPMSFVDMLFLFSNYAYFFHKI